MFTTIFHCALSQHLCKCNTGTSIIITLHPFKYEYNCKPSPFTANSLQEVFICHAHSGMLCIQLAPILISWWISVFSTHSSRIVQVSCSLPTLVCLLFCPDSLWWVFYFVCTLVCSTFPWIGKLTLKALLMFHQCFLPGTHPAGCPSGGVLRTILKVFCLCAHFPDYIHKLKAKFRAYC